MRRVTEVKLRRTRLIGAALLAAPLMAIALVAVSFLLGPSDPSAPYFPTTRLNANHAGSAEISGMAVTAGPSHNLKSPTGPVARPDSRVTPGVVATTDVGAVCKTSKHVPRISPTNPLIPLSEQDAIFKAYRISPSASKRYALDFLIPMQLGGAMTAANVWPMSTTKGVGFTEKQLLNVRMHILVCHGEMPLTQAQTLMANDWVGLWVRYGA
jgi:hypothetical protein